MAGQTNKPRTRQSSDVADGDFASDEKMPSADATTEETEETVAAPGGDLLRRAHEMLVEQGIPLSTATLAGRVFGSVAPAAGMAGITGMVSPWERMLEQLLGASSLFLRDEEGNWGLASWGGAERLLEDVEFVALDVETTGLAPGRHRVIEIGAVIIRNGELMANFSKLINPGRSIPQFITKFTGISPQLVARSASAEKVLPRLRDFIGDRPIVGHNIGFDLNFLNFEAERCGQAGFAEAGIDTIRLARRYLTGMRRVRLDVVASALHVPMRNRHRALPDAQITAKVFVLLLARAREEGCETLADLYRVLDGAAPDHNAQPPRRLTGRMYLNPAWRKQFPITPGVYLMKDEAGEVIYVGKAKCLRNRLASYYNQPLGYTRKMDGLLQNVREIETRMLGSELEALLVESRLIKQLQPRYNVQLRNYEHYPFIKVDVQHPYPRFYATREVSADGARYFGPFRSGRIVNATIELIQKVFPIRTCTRNLPPGAPASEPCLRYHLKRCPAPCRGELDEAMQAEYRRVVGEACAFLGGEREDLIDRLKQEMFAASARQDFERAARLRDALRDADQVLLGQRLVTGAVEANNLLIVYPSVEADHVEMFLVRHGRLAEQRRVGRTVDGLLPELRAIIAEAAELGAPPSRVGREEVDQINIIARWIHHHSDDEERAFFRLPHNLRNEAELADFEQHVIKVLTTPVVDVLTDEVEEEEEREEEDKDGQEERVEGVELEEI